MMRSFNCTIQLGIEKSLDAWSTSSWELGQSAICRVSPPTREIASILSSSTTLSRLPCCIGRTPRASTFHCSPDSSRTSSSTRGCLSAHVKRRQLFLRDRDDRSLFRETTPPRTWKRNTGEHPNLKFCSQIVILKPHPQIVVFP